MRNENARIAAAKTGVVENGELGVGADLVGAMGWGGGKWEKTA